MTTGITLGTSGLDIDQLVTNSMKTYQAKYDKAYKAEQKAEWTKSAYADIYSAVKTFQATASDYKLSSNTSAHTVTSTSTAVTAKANANATCTSHSVTVTSLASNVSLQTYSTISADSINLGTIAGVDTTNTSTDTALSFTLSDGTSTKTISYTYLQLNGGTDSSGNTVTAKTLNDLASDIKSAGLNISASYDSTSDSFSLYNTETGSANTLKITLDGDTTGDGTTSTTAGINAKALFTGLDLAVYDGTDGSFTQLSSSSTLSLYDGTLTGTNASFTVDGKSYSTSSNTNTINNVVYTLTDITSSTAKLTVAVDTDTVVEKVQAFVDAYNKVLDAINTATHETKYSDYEALTDDEKEDMSEDEITAWNEKAKSGLLKNDSILTKISDAMRSAISDTVESITGSYTSLSSIGITSSSDYTDYGQISLDTDTLEKALADDPDCVYNLFSTKGTSSYTKGTSNYTQQIYDNNGIAYRLYNISTDGMGSIEDQAGTSASYTDDTTSVLGIKITAMQENLDTLQDWLDDKEDYFYNKYNAMETAMTSYSSQISTLTSMLSS